MKCLYVILLLCCTEMAKAVIPAVEAQRDPVLGVVGDNLTLPCYLKNNVNAEGMNIQWIINGKLVHHYKEHTDITDDLLPEYRNRTSLFRDELQRGNISLKLTSIRLSDTNTYKCYVSADEGTDEAEVMVQVNELGNEPEVTAKSHYNGKVTLVCTSTNWTIRPVIEWLDNKGKVFPTTEDPDYCQSHDTTLYVYGHLTVKEEDGYDYTCKVSHLNHQKKKQFNVNRKLFGQERDHWIPIVPLMIFLFIFIFFTLFIMCYNSEKRRFHFYKTDIKTQTNAWNVELDYFIIPMVIHGHRKIHIIEEAHIHRKKDYRSISVEQLLSRDDHRSVILQGESGLGKSCTLKWILREWASGKCYLDHFDLVFLLECDELTLSSKKKTLLDLINDDQCHTDLIKKTLEMSPHRVLFLIDGFNEFTLSEEDTKSSPADPFTQAHTKFVLNGLLSGRILPESPLLVTTRPSASARLNNLLKERPKKFAEILGFTEKGVEGYFTKFFKDNGHEFQNVKMDDMLFTSCFNPVLCWIICHGHMKEQRTIASIFLNYFTILLPRQCNIRSVLSQLCDQAKRVMQGGKNQFEWDSIQFPELIGILKCINPGQEKKMYRFIHQSFVEFFAALRYAILENEQLQREEVEDLLMSAQNDLLIPKPHLQPVLKFLFGLSNKAVRKALQKILYGSSSSSSHDSFSIQTQLKQWVLARKDTFSSNKSVLFLFHCLHELHEGEFVKEVVQLLEDISFLYIPLTHSDCLVIQYCLQAYPLIKHLDLRHCNITAEKLKLLQPVWANLQYNELWLTAEGLKKTDVEEFLTSSGLLRSRQKEQTMNLQFSSMKNIPLGTVSKLLNMYQRTKNLSLSLEIDTADDDSFCSSFSARRDDLLLILEIDTADDDSFCSSFSARRDDLLLILTFGYHKAKPNNTQQAGPEVLFISLTLPTPEATCKSASDSISYRSSEDWTQFLQKVDKLRQADSLLSEHLNSLTDLKRLEFEVSYLTEDWASKTLYCIHACPKLLDLKAVIADEESQEKSKLSSLTIRRVTERAFCLETGSVSLILSTSAVSSQEKSSDLLQKIIRLKDVTDQGLEELVECVQVLLSIPSVEKVKLWMRSVPVDLAKMTLSFCSNLHKIFVTLETPANRVVGSVCSSLCVEKEAGSLKLSVMDGRISSSSYTTPALSGITLHLESPIREMDWEQFFTTFYSLRGISASSAVSTFLLSLTGLHGLKKVDLLMSTLSDGIKESINALRNACSTLQEVRVSCGRNGLVGDKIVWVGDDEPDKGRFAFTFTVKR